MSQNLSSAAVMISALRVNIIILFVVKLNNSRQGHDLPISVFAISREFYFQETSLRSFAKIKPSRKISNLQYFAALKQRRTVQHIGTDSLFINQLLNDFFYSVRNDYFES